MFAMAIILGLETIILICGAMLYRNVTRDYHEQYEEDCRTIRLLDKANRNKDTKIDSIVAECDKALKVNNYNNVHTTLRIIKELAVGKNN